MNITVHPNKEHPNAVYVSLSRRNLKDLLAMLDQKQAGYLGRKDGELVIRVEPQEDEAHYKDRKNEAGPGFKDASWRQN